MFLLKMNKKNMLNIIILYFIIVGFMYFYYANNTEMTKMTKMKEGLTDIHIDTGLSSDFSKSFCESTNSSGAELQKECQKLTKGNCRSTSCCIWASNEKCYAGGKDGLLFNTESDGKKIELDYYYYKDTCYGKKCK